MVKNTYPLPLIKELIIRSRYFLDQSRPVKVQVKPKKCQKTGLDWTFKHYCYAQNINNYRFAPLRILLLR